MKLILKIEIEATGYEAYRRLINEAIRQLAISNEYMTTQQTQTETSENGKFHLFRDCEILAMTDKGQIEFPPACGERLKEMYCSRCDKKTPVNYVKTLDRIYIDCAECGDRKGYEPVEKIE